MLKKTIFLISLLITAAHAMDNAGTQELAQNATQATNELPEWVQKATTIAVIIEKSYLTEKAALLPINDDTVVGALLVELQRANNVKKPSSIDLVACYVKAKTLYLYTHKSDPLRSDVKIKEYMKEYDTTTFELIEKAVK